jgi:hypothetical protein
MKGRAASTDAGRTAEASEECHSAQIVHDDFSTITFFTEDVKQN